MAVNADEIGQIESLSSQLWCSAPFACRDFGEKFEEQKMGQDLRNMCEKITIVTIAGDLLL